MDEQQSKQERRESVERQLQHTAPGTGTASPARERPVDESEVTDEEPDSPHGVGESVTRRGEDVEQDEGKEPGRHDAGVEYPAERPVGTSTPRDTTGVDPD